MSVIVVFLRPLGLRLLPSPPLFGWIEKDGDLGDHTGPTSSDEAVNRGQQIEPNVVVNISPCYSCICDSNSFFNCSVHTDSWADAEDFCLIKRCDKTGEVLVTDKRTLCECSENEELVVLDSTNSNSIPAGDCCTCRPKTVTPTVTTTIKPTTTVAPTTTTSRATTSPSIEQTTPPAPCLPTCRLYTSKEQLTFNTTAGEVGS